MHNPVSNIPLATSALVALAQVITRFVAHIAALVARATRVAVEVVRRNHRQPNALGMVARHTYEDGTVIHVRDFPSSNHVSLTDSYSVA